MSPNLRSRSTEPLEDIALQMSHHLETRGLTVDWEIFVERLRKTSLAVSANSTEVEKGGIDRIGVGIRVPTLVGGTANVYSSSTSPAIISEVIRGVIKARDLLEVTNGDVLPSVFHASGIHKTFSFDRVSDAVAAETMSAEIYSASGDSATVSGKLREICIYRRGYDPYLDYETELGATLQRRVNDDIVFYPTIVLGGQDMGIGGSVLDLLRCEIDEYPLVGARPWRRPFSPDFAILHPAALGSIMRCVYRFIAQGTLEAVSLPQWLAVFDDPVSPDGTLARDFDDAGQSISRTTIVKEGRSRLTDLTALPSFRQSYRALPRPHPSTLTISGSDGDLPDEYVWIDSMMFAESTVEHPEDILSGPVEGWVKGSTGLRSPLVDARVSVKWIDLINAIEFLGRGKPVNSGGTRNTLCGMAVVRRVLADGLIAC